MNKSFSGPKAFLSNFYLDTFDWKGHPAVSSEHAYQSEKAINPDDKLWILQAKTPGEAKRRGRLVEKDPAFDKTKINIMLEILRVKFRNPYLAKKLLETGTEQLVEGNSWGDTFWGVCNGKGSNHLGKCLMQIREELRKVQ